MRGGATKSFLAMADGVAREGHTVKVVVPDENGVVGILKARGWEVLPVAYRFCALPRWESLRDKLMFLPRLAKYYLENRKARKVVKKFAEKYQPDIIHDNTSVTDIGHYAAKHIGATHVIHIREYGWKDFRLVLPFLRERLRYRKAAIIAITEDLRKLRGGDVAIERQTTIYNGVVRHDQFRYHPDKQPEFLYAGRVQKTKGVEDLIEAYLKYSNDVMAEGRQPFRLIMAGSMSSDPELVGALQVRLREAGIDERVEWKDEISNVDEYMERVAATIIPSKWEGFGRVMPEAMSCGSLCVARDTGGSREQMNNGLRLTSHEIALRFDDAESLRACLKEIDEAYHQENAFAEGEKYEKMIKDSQKVVKNYYLCEEVGQKTLNFYKQLLEQDRKK